MEKDPNFNAVSYIPYGCDAAVQLPDITVISMGAPEVVTDIPTIVSADEEVTRSDEDSVEEEQNLEDALEEDFSKNHQKAGNFSNTLKPGDSVQVFDFLGDHNWSLGCKILSQGTLPGTWKIQCKEDIRDNIPAINVTRSRSKKNPPFNIKKRSTKEKTAPAAKKKSKKPVIPNEVI